MGITIVELWVQESSLDEETSSMKREYTGNTVNGKIVMAWLE
ncbi:MAG TPA: hypothetical protein VNU46_04325 [Gemmatimonadaceae bacterium]|jgi:hypothetical protein|nr:hypothetical protein [Gemmatimonadaceae bacterium]